MLLAQVATKYSTAADVTVMLMFVEIILLWRNILKCDKLCVANRVQVRSWLYATQSVFNTGIVFKPFSSRIFCNTLRSSG